MIFDITHDGRTTLATTREDALALGYPAAAIDAAEAAAIAAQSRIELRAAITAGAGDTDSLLGTTTDVTHLLLLHIGSAFAALSTATTVEAVRKAALPFADLTAPFRAGVQSGKVQLPFLAKGVPAILEDVETRATAVADVLAANEAEQSNEGATT